MKKSFYRFVALVELKKVGISKFEKFCSFFCQKRVTVHSILGSFHNFRKSGSGRCSKCCKTCKNKRKFKIQKYFEKFIPKLSFAVGFIEIHQIARFLQHFEISQKYVRIFRSNFTIFRKCAR